MNLKNRKYARYICHEIYTSLEYCIITARQRIGEGSVFDRVCLSVILSTGGGLTLQGPNPVSPAQGPAPRHFQTCSGWTPPYRTSPPPTPPHPPAGFKLVHYEACTIGKWESGTLKECICWTYVVSERVVLWNIQDSLWISVSNFIEIILKILCQFLYCLSHLEDHGTIGKIMVRSETKITFFADGNHMYI